MGTLGKSPVGRAMRKRKRKRGNKSIATANSVVVRWGAGLGIYCCDRLYLSSRITANADSQSNGDSGGSGAWGDHPWKLIGHPCGHPRSDRKLVKFVNTRNKRNAVNQWWQISWFRANFTFLMLLLLLLLLLVRSGLARLLMKQEDGHSNTVNCWIKTLKSVY